MFNKLLISIVLFCGFFILKDDSTFTSGIIVQPMRYNRVSTEPTFIIRTRDTSLLDYLSNNHKSFWGDTGGSLMDTIDSNVYWLDKKVLEHFSWKEKKSFVKGSTKERGYYYLFIDDVEFVIQDWERPYEEKSLFIELGEEYNNFLKFIQVNNNLIVRVSSTEGKDGKYVGVLGWSKFVLRLEGNHTFLLEQQTKPATLTVGGRWKVYRNEKLELIKETPVVLSNPSDTSEFAQMGEPDTWVIDLNDFEGFFINNDSISTRYKGQELILIKEN